MRWGSRSRSTFGTQSRPDERRDHVDQATNRPRQRASEEPGVRVGAGGRRAVRGDRSSAHRPPDRARAVAGRTRETLWCLAAGNRPPRAWEHEPRLATLRRVAHALDADLILDFAFRDRERRVHLADATEVDDAETFEHYDDPAHREPRRASHSASPCPTARTTRPRSLPSGHDRIRRPLAQTDGMTVSAWIRRAVTRRFASGSVRSASPSAKPDSQRGTDASRCKCGSTFVYAVRVSRRRLRRRSEKARRHAAADPAAASSSRSRSDACRATRLHAHAGGRGARREPLHLQPPRLPLIETVEMPGERLVPVDELERLLAEQRRAYARVAPTKRGRPQVLSPDLVTHIRAEREAGRSLRQIASDLNDQGVATAHGGARWWPSTVRSILARSSRA